MGGGGGGHSKLFFPDLKLVLTSDKVELMTFD